MSLRTCRQLQDDARKRGYAVGAFNVDNIEMIRGVIEVAVEENAPVIVAISEDTVAYAGWELCCDALPKMAAAAPVPIAVHLDHGVEFANCIRAIVGGLSSVMYDCSMMPFAENVAEMKRLVAVAHPVGISVEAEIGHVGGGECGGVASCEVLTDPEEARRFAVESGVDTLAVAVGTVHGMRCQTAKLDLERITAIASVVPIPIVLHGASGVPDEAFAEVISRGITKINVGTQLMKSFSAGMRKAAADNPEIIDIKKLLKPGMEMMKEAVRSKVRLFMSNGKAR